MEDKTTGTLNFVELVPVHSMFGCYVYMHLSQSQKPSCLSLFSALEKTVLKQITSNTRPPLSFTSLLVVSLTLAWKVGYRVDG